MKQVTVVSGKGGTGKTSMVAAFANLSKSCVIADCDVDAANLHLILAPQSDRAASELFRSGYEVAVDDSLCSGCLCCARACRFGAINLSLDNSIEVDSLLCEGCGACIDACRSGVLRLREKVAGELLISNTRFGPLVRGRLGIAQATSGKLVSLVRTKARDLAEKDERALVLIDGSPGIGCPVISSLTGADAAVVVTEPTVSGIHDLKRILDLCKHFNLPALVVVNKCDLNPEMAKILEKESVCQGAKAIGKIKYDAIFTQSLLVGQTVIEYSSGEGELALQIRQIWDRVKEAINIS